MFKANCNKFTAAYYPDLSKVLERNDYLDVFEVFNNDMGSQKEMELAEFTLNKATKRKDKTFVSVGNLEKYLEAQKKSKEPKEAIPPEGNPIVPDQNPKVPEAVENHPKENNDETNQKDA